jgi:hypothetical protein
MSVFVVTAGRYSHKKKHKNVNIELIDVFLDKKSAKEYAKTLINENDDGIVIADWYKIHNLTKEIEELEK